MVRALIHGVAGRMGQMLLACAKDAPDIEIVAGVDRVEPDDHSAYAYYPTLDACADPVDVIIDFTRASSLPGLIEYATRTQTRLVIATTGHSDEDRARVAAAAQSVAIFQAANMALGINEMIELAVRTTSALPAFDIEIIEKHHNTKIDAPSGTALWLAETLRDERLSETEFTFERHSRLQPREKKEIGIHSIRGGTIVGEHKVMFIGSDEVLSIEHIAYSRRIFALGALRAVCFISDKPAGLYSMKDLLLEKSGVTNLYIDPAQALITVARLPHSASAVGAVLSALAESNINVDMIGQTAPQGNLVDLSFTLAAADLAAATEKLQSLKIGAHLDIATDIVKLTVEGPGMERQSGVAARVFEILGQADISVRLITTSETKISMCIDRRHEERALALLRGAFRI